MEDKIACLIFVFACYSIILFGFGFGIGNIQTTNFCKENLVKIVCPKTNDYLTYKYKTFEEVLKLVKSKEIKQ